MAHAELSTPIQTTLPPPNTHTTLQVAELGKKVREGKILAMELG